MQPRHEFLHGPRAVALCGRQGAHEGFDLVGQWDVALDAAIHPVAWLRGALCALPDGLQFFLVRSKNRRLLGPVWCAQ